MEVSDVRHDAAGFEFGAQTHARVSRKDENQRRPQSAGAPQGQGPAQADRLTRRSVVCNRSKRRFRELGRQSLARLEPGLDLLIVPKRESVTEPAQRLRESWQALLAREKLLALGNTQ